MAQIQVMPAHLADLIAAGEVVERPASVVKELLENAVDAGATSVTVEIQNGGMTLIRVTDNGCGMAREDVPTAFLRHATSKLQTEDQLSSIATLGFRGEALAAIAAVSRVQVLTRRAEDQEGTCMTLEAGVQTGLEPAGCPAGTTILIRDLFYNTPARQKFMKRDSAEASQVLGVVQKQALANPGVAYRLLKQGAEQLSTPGDGSLESAVYCVLGREAAGEMEPVESRWNGIGLSGCVSRPTASRGNRNYQHFFINGRWVKSKTMTAALEQAYKTHIMTGRYPACVLHVTLPLQAVDVNVHPAKTEVRFLSDRDVFDTIYYGVLEALSKVRDRPELTLDQPGRGQAAEEASEEQSRPISARSQGPGLERSLPAFAVPETKTTLRPVLQTPQEAAMTPQAREDFYRTMSAQDYRDYLQTKTGTSQTKNSGSTLQGLYDAFLQNQARTQPDRGLRSPMPTPQSFAQTAAGAEAAGRAEQPEPVPAGREDDFTSSGWPDFPVRPGADAPDRKTEGTQTPEPLPEEQMALPLPQTPAWRVIGEALKTYILVEEGDTVYLIDKHAAHERVLFEKYRAQKEPITAQLLLEPLALQLGAPETEALLAAPEVLTEYGYEAEDFGGGILLVRQIPADIDLGQAQSALEELAATLLEGGRTDPTALREERLHTVACKAAIKAGYDTDPAQLEYLAGLVMNDPGLKHCPHGRPICIQLTRTAIEKQFRRIV